MRLVFLGMSRTGSTSVWAFFKNHPEVSISIPKEYITLEKNDLSNYIQKAHFVNNNIEVLLDGSPNIFFKQKRFDNILNSLKSQGIDDFKQIYLLRDPIEMLTSRVNINIVRYTRGTIDKPKFIDVNLNIIESGLTDLSTFVLNEYDLLRRVEDSIGKENMFIVKLQEFESRQSEVFNFLGIDNSITYKFPKSNTTSSLGFSIKHLKAKSKAIKWINNNLESLQTIIKENEEKRKERYGI